MAGQPELDIMTYEVLAQRLVEAEEDNMALMKENAAYRDSVKVMSSLMEKEDALKKCKKCGARKEKYKAMKEADLMAEREKRLPQDSDSEDSLMAGVLNSMVRKSRRGARLIQLYACNEVSFSQL